jgi:hypothetical protein
MIVLLLLVRRSHFELIPEIVCIEMLDRENVEWLLLI